MEKGGTWEEKRSGGWEMRNTRGGEMGKDQPTWTVQTEFLTKSCMVAYEW